MVEGEAQTLRSPAVAGLFYPADGIRLEADVRGLLEGVGNVVTPPESPPKALIVPHAGYVYSGPVAAAAYRRIEGLAGKITRIVLIGPAHRVPFEGLALPGVDGFETPLGTVPVDKQVASSIADMAQIKTLPAAHDGEHSLEVHLPFLQVLLDDFSLVPLVAGRASAEEVAEVLEALWGGEETLIVISTDLSHYHEYNRAKALDAATSRAIEALDEARIGYEDACGRTPLSGLLRAARQRGLGARMVDLRNSGDTAGPRHQVVGYGAYIVG